MYFRCVECKAVELATLPATHYSHRCYECDIWNVPFVWFLTADLAISTYEKRPDYDSLVATDPAPDVDT